MNNIAEWFDRFLAIFTATNLQLLLLIGSGILAISLLVLALTRWGHSRPVWKCVILSFVAHILLIGYAYGTRLIFEAPAFVNDATPMRVNLIEETGETVDGKDLLDTAAESWNQFVNQPALPTIENLERPEIDSEVVIKKMIDRSVAQPESEVAAEELDQIFQNVDDPEFAQTPSPAPQEYSHVDLPIEPRGIDVARRGDDELQLEGPAVNMPEELARQEVNNDFVPLKSDGQSPELRSPVEVDNSFVSDLVDRDSELAFGQESLPKPAVAPAFENMKPLRSNLPKNELRVVTGPRRIGDGQPLPKIYSLRNAQDRLAVARKRGGSIETEQAVERGLRWLAENQEDDGSWSSRKSGGGQEDRIFGHDRKNAGAQADCGITGLAMLSFLAAGQSHLEGQYHKQVQQGLEYLVRQQSPNGDLAGSAKLFARMYCHSMSLLALSEALAMTGDERLKSAVQRGVNFSVSAQNRVDGGWRYQPGDTGDMSQFGWQVLALRSAKLGGAVVPQSTFERMGRFLESCSSGIGNGLASYRPKQGVSTTMTAEALLCRYMLDQTVAPTTLLEASRRIATEKPTPHHVNLYYWYYGTLAMYHAGGSNWDQWNNELKKTLLTLQNRGGANGGSWSPAGVWGGYGGRVYSTAMATLNLQVYYRYLPIYSELAGATEFRETERR